MQTYHPGIMQKPGIPAHQMQRTGTRERACRSGTGQNPLAEHAQHAPQPRSIAWGGGGEAATKAAHLAFCERALGNRSAMSLTSLVRSAQILPNMQSRVVRFKIPRFQTAQWGNTRRTRDPGKPRPPHRSARALGSDKHTQHNPPPGKPPLPRLPHAFAKPHPRKPCACHALGSRTLFPAITLHPPFPSHHATSPPGSLVTSGAEGYVAPTAPAWTSAGQPRPTPVHPFS